MDIFFELFICLGCAWHGHDCYYEPDEVCLNGKRAALNLEMVETRRQELEANGLNVYMLWECQVREEMSQNPEMADYMESIHCWSPIVPRDGFHGYL
jgi:G:T-mismatch repair DNA endonuclease (very short patch repair protein)